MHGVTYQILWPNVPNCRHTKNKIITKFCERTEPRNCILIFQFQNFVLGHIDRCDTDGADGNFMKMINSRCKLQGVIALDKLKV